MVGIELTLLDDKQWPTAAFSVNLPIKPESAALVIIDVQHYSVDPNDHLAHTIQKHSQALYDEYAKRVDVMVGNIQRLLETFRSAGRRVVHTRHGKQSPDGSDLIVRRRNRETIALGATNGESGHMAIRGKRGYEIIPDLAPVTGELVLDKNTSSAFNSTPIDLFLRNMKLETIVLTGIAADQCVLATALDAADRGFHVIIADDACVTWDPDSATAVQTLFRRIWGYVMSTQEVVDWLQTGQLPKRMASNNGKQQEQ